MMKRPFQLMAAVRWGRVVLALSFGVVATYLVAWVCVIAFDHTSFGYYAWYEEDIPDTVVVLDDASTTIVRGAAMGSWPAIGAIESLCVPTGPSIERLMVLTGGGSLNVRRIDAGLPVQALTMTGELRGTPHTIDSLERPAVWRASTSSRTEPHRSEGRLELRVAHPPDIARPRDQRGLLVVGLRGCARRVRFGRRRRRGRCGACAYPVAETTICPECGAGIEPLRPRRKRPRVRRVTASVLIALTLTYASAWACVTGAIRERTTPTTEARVIVDAWTYEYTAEEVALEASHPRLPDTLATTIGATFFRQSEFPFDGQRAVQQTAGLPFQGLVAAEVVGRPYLSGSFGRPKFTPVQRLRRAWFAGVHTSNDPFSPRLPVRPNGWRFWANLAIWSSAAYALLTVWKRVRHSQIARRSRRAAFPDQANST